MTRNYHQGTFIPQNPQKYAGDISKIFYRSSWERKFFVFCDNNPSVLKWGSEEVVVPYIKPTDNRPHRYFPDFIIMYKDKNGEIHKELIEIKPSIQTKMPKPPKTRINTKRYLSEIETFAVNQAKWEAATKWCEKRNMKFRILTEKDLGIG